MSAATKSDLLENLLTGRANCDLTQRLDISKQNALFVANSAAILFQAENLCLQINEDVVVVADIHGQFDDLLGIIRANGFPPKVRYLFLGNYIDIGIFSLEVIMLVFLLKMTHPEHVFLLRGNHENKTISKVYGFYDEIKQRYNNDYIWRAYCNAFSYMPICAVIGGKYLCCHDNLAEIFSEKKIGNSVQEFVVHINEEFYINGHPDEIVEETDIFKLLWSNLENSVQTKLPLFKGSAASVNEKTVKKFLKKHKIDKIICADHFEKAGAGRFCGNKFLTIFSAPGFWGLEENLGAICSLVVGKMDTHGVSSNIDIKIETLKPSLVHFNCKELWVKAEDIKNAELREFLQNVKLDENKGKYPK